MSATRGTPLRTHRTPLRDVQNETSTTQRRTPAIKLPDITDPQTENLCRLSGPIDDWATITGPATNVGCREEGSDYLNEYQGNVTFKSFTCAGGEVELSEESGMSDESAVIGALTLEDCPQTFNITTVICEEDTETAFRDLDKHVDHPYSSHPCDEPSSELIMTRDAENQVQGVQQSDTVLSAVSGQTEAASEQADITFKSFSCPGGEIQIADMSLAQDELLNATDEAKDEFQSNEDEGEIEDESEVLDEHPGLALQPSPHMDHPYCQHDLEPLSPTPNGSVSPRSAVLCPPQESESAVGDPAYCAPELNTAAEIPLVDVQGDLTLKSLYYSGVEVEIENADIQSEMSVLMKDLTLVSLLQSSLGCDVILSEGEGTAVLSSGIKHADHLYCHAGDGDIGRNDPAPPSAPETPIISEFTSTSGSRCLSAGSLESSETNVPDLADATTSGSQKVVGSAVESEVSEISTELPEELLSSTEESIWSVCSSLLRGSGDEAEGLEALQCHIAANVDAASEGLSASYGPPVFDPAEVQLDSPQTPSENREVLLDVCKSAESRFHTTDTPAENFPAESGNVGGRNVAVETSAGRDSALGLSGDHAHTDVEVLRSESACDGPCEPASLHTQLKRLSATCLPDPLTPRNLLSVVRADSESRLWAELSDSPIPPPQFNSTALPSTPAPCPKPRENPSQRDRALLDLSAMGKGPLQQQLRHMAELLILASGKIAGPATPAPGRYCSAEVATSPVQQHSACVWTTPVLQADTSTNTSAQMEVVKDVHVSDACTSTDPLLWSVNPSSLETLSRSQLEQKLLTTLIMVEVLSQQLSSTQASCSRVSTAPSDLRDCLVQTDHTQLSQAGPYRELYVSALERIRALEDDQETLGSLLQVLQHVTGTLTSVRSSTAETLGSLRQVERLVNDDQEVLSKQVREMKALYSRCVGTLRKMEQKTKACLQEREDMRDRMNEAVNERLTVLRVLEQLRAHHTAQVSELQEEVGSQQVLTAALTHTHPQLVELNRSSVESVSAACVLLRETTEDHAHLAEELHKTHQLLQRTSAVLSRLQQRALAAVEQSWQYQAERDAALEDRGQLETELQQTQCSLRDADLHIADLNTQVTILSSEMAVLREQLVEVEEERTQLQVKSTELSATVSSSLASYAFLEQALASETSKLQHSLHECQEATEKASTLQTALQESQRRVEELEEVLDQRTALLTQLHAEVEAQRLQLRRLSQVESELFSAREMSEFLQVETEMSREQLVESENLLRLHLQGLRERNLECEDLRLALEQLRLERASLQEEVDGTRAKARSMLLEQGEQLAQAMLDVSLLHNRVRSLTSTTRSYTTSTTSSDPAGLDVAAQRPLQTPRRPCTSFLNSVMLALTEEQQCETVPPADQGEAEPGDVIGGSSSAFTRITVAVPQHVEEESSNTLVGLVSSLGDSVSDFQSAVQQLKEHKDSEVQSLQSEVRNLQEALQAESDRHMEAEAELRQQVSRLKAQVEKGTQVLHQKTQEEKALRKLCSDLEETVQTEQKHRAENSELRREGVELRRALQQSQVEVQALREELLRSANQTSASTKQLDDRIHLLKEVEKLKVSLTEVEESRTRLLERAKRHQMVHSMNQSKLERELHLLDDMIETVRKTLSSIPEVVKNSPELLKLVDFIG
ncbi:sperm-associated antigen 5 [Brachyhypopomus gauderio]|uniref:sperm-associated antigen 5 n=1 Tax=Brachyhypopomus gauderio TaxID=698409 RepID=UPI0040421385